MSNRVEAAQKSASNIFGTVHGPLMPKVICDHGEGIYLFDQDAQIRGSRCLAEVIPHFRELSTRENKNPNKTSRPYYKGKPMIR